MPYQQKAIEIHPVTRTPYAVSRLAQIRLGIYITRTMRCDQPWAKFDKDQANSDHYLVQ